jgi:serine/threonine-protein kinase
VAGSPHYLAPEQLEGGAVDARTDIHALGVVFYELLAGRKAFDGDTVDQITNAVLNNHPAPAHEIRSHVPPVLSAMAAKAMARDPNQRYSSAAAMATELRRWFEQQAASATSEGPPSSPLSSPSHGALLLEAPARAAPALGVRARATQRVKQALWLALALAAAATAGFFTRGQPQDAQPPAAHAVAAAAVATPAPASGVAAPNEAVAQAPTTEVAPASATPATPPAPPASLVTTVAARPPNSAPRANPAPARSKAALATATREPAVPPPAAPAATGTLQLAVSPWGHVEVNGTPAGATPPLTRLTLPEGTHTITLRNDDFPPFTATVQVSADKPASLRHRFSP